MERKEFVSMMAVAGTTMLACGAACATDEKTDYPKPCPNKEGNNKQCNCTNTSCVRHGNCCQCVFYHRAKKEKPFCLR